MVDRELAWKSICCGGSSIGNITENNSSSSKTSTGISQFVATS